METGRAAPLTVESHLTPADWAAFQKLFMQRLQSTVGMGRRIATVLGPLLAGALLVGFGMGEPAPRALPVFFMGLAAMFCAIQLSSRQILRHAVPDQEGTFLGRVRMEFSAEGIHIVRSGTSGLTLWRGVKEVTATDTHVFLWLDPLAAYIVPRRDLPGEDARAFLDQLRELAGPLPTTEASGPPALSGGAEAPAPAPGFLATLVRRLAWRRVPADGWGASDGMILTCAAAALAIWLAFDRNAAGAKAEWHPRGLTDVAWYASGVVALAWLLHRASRGEARFRPLLAAIVSALPLLLAVGASLRQWAPKPAQPAGYALLGLAAFVQATRGLIAAGDRRPFLPLVAGSAFALLFTTVSSAAWVEPRLWFADEDDGTTANAWVDSEHMLFAQADRIDAAVAGMAGERAHRADVFFVGFAGVAEQKVFAEELKLAERVVTERYQATGRSLLLVNDKRDHDHFPIATVQGLRRALVKVGTRMNREEDVLFLMLSSHGSDAPLLSVSNGYWPLEQLDGRTLRAALDESGIRWRVVVISACHSGAFIEPLADPNTIVLTASAKDRTSFGCSDENDTTYFGAALMRDALPGAESLADAFDRAKQLVAERERQDKLDESRPQAYYGSAIQPYWQRIDAERRASAERH